MEENMPYLQTVSEEDATGKLREQYDAERAGSGYISNHTKALSLRPEVIAAWRGLSRAIRTGMDARRYELVTIAVASKLRCSY